MEKRVALVTGANAGMGKATAIALARRGMHVVMLCRDQARGEAALCEIRRASGSEEVTLMLCDLGDMAQVRRFSAAFHAAYARLDVLINNAGVICLGRQETKDGLELQFGVNHIGHFLLTNLLLDRMGPGARIVVVGSGAHRVGRIDFDDLAMKRSYSVVAGYSRSKLCNLLFTRALARKLLGAGITVNCVHPGAVATDIAINRRTGFGRTITRVLGWVARTPEQGAATAIHVATSDACAGITGEYFAGGKLARSSRRSKDMRLAEALWAVSLRITGLDGA